jgi:hypothetical protein
MAGKGKPVSMEVILMILSLAQLSLNQVGFTHAIVCRDRGQLAKVSDRQHRYSFHPLAGQQTGNRVD